MRQLLLVFLLSAGCLDDFSGAKHFDVDACSGAALANQICTTLHLSAEQALAGAQVTSIFMWVLYTTASGERYQPVQTLMKVPTAFPIAVGLHFPLTFESFANLDVEALNGPGIVAYGQVSVDPGTTMHDNDELTMQRPAISGCFDGRQDGGETGVDCGGQTCPPCDSGNRCSSGNDCKTLNCQFDTNTDEELCQ